MGQTLRLDGRIEVEADPDDPGVNLVVRAVPGGASGRAWAIECHRKARLRLRSWEKRRELAFGSTDVVEGDGVRDFHNLPAGIYLAESAVYPGARIIPAQVVFRVAGDRVEVLAGSAEVAAQRDRVLAELSGWTVERLAAERAAYALGLAERAEVAGFAPLEGSERQVTWANEFRGTKIDHAREYAATKGQQFNEAAARCHYDPCDEDSNRLAAAAYWLEFALPLLGRIVDASWWVSRVSTPGRDILRELARECRAEHKRQKAGRAER